MVFIMSKCNQCNVEIKDNVSLCPLCKSVLEKTDQSVNVYPNVRVIARKHDLWIRIYLFLAVVAETLLLYFNYRTFEGSFWSIVTGVVLLYVLIGLKLMVKDNMESKTKTIILILTGILGVVLIDVLTGFHGWSLNYFLPGGMMLLNTVIILLMVVNMRNWQSYVMIELLTLLGSLFSFILFRMGLVTKVNMSLLAFAYSFFLFAGTIIVGGRRAATELKRRFHVR